jgi:hypothetical protein
MRKQRIDGFRSPHGPRWRQTVDLQPWRQPAMSIPRSIAIATAGALAVLAIGACSRSNNVLLGRVETTLGGHRVAVTDCYKFFGIPKAKKLSAASYRYAPCKDVDIVIQDDTLFVNGTSYGDLGDGDSVTVDDGHVLINGKLQ